MGFLALIFPREKTGWMCDIFFKKDKNLIIRNNFLKTVIQGVEKVSNGKLSTTKGIIDHSIDDIKIVIGRDIIGWTQEITYNIVY